ncbi:organic cation transporter protein-like [Homarus americanus]|uniref:organic cation transporter protein-like n=1 Tax=Homarus americanus TaxID=6706 RepID=UPI001C494CF9|nr:organic cation transporter protein-like [Homarus americanus]
MAITEFDSVFNHIGGFGRYQMGLFVVNCIMNVFLAFIYFGQMFMTLTPPHWCRPPPGLQELNLTQEELMHLTIPKDNTSEKFLQCRRYDVDFVEVRNNNHSWPNTSWPTVKCTHGWNYDYSFYYPTITSQLDWVCDDDWLPTLSQSLFFVGSLVASPLLGWASDKWGRLPIIVSTNMLGGVAGIISAFCSSFVSFTIFRFIVGMTYDTHFMVTYILLLEYVSSEYRTVMANVPIMFFLTAAMCSMPWIALGVANWSTFAIIIHAPQLISLFFIWLVPESARWLISKGRTDDTVKILKKAASVNGKTLTPDFLEEFREYGSKQAKNDESTATVMDLLNTPVLRRRFLVLCIMWMVIITAYDAHMRNTKNIGGNVFVTFTIAGFVELPADFLTMVFVEKLGRRHTTVFTLIFGGLACFIIAGIPEVQKISLMYNFNQDKMYQLWFVRSGQQYPVEVLPTVARGSGSMAIHTVGYLAAFTSPYIVYLSKFGYYLPYLVIGMITVAGGLCCIGLPETLNQILPDSLQDGETYFCDQSFFYNPCYRKNEDVQEDVITMAGMKEGVDNASCLENVDKGTNKEI